MACGRSIRKFFVALGLVVFTAAIVTPAPLQAEPVKVTVKVDTSAGYARLLFTLSNEIDVSAQTTGSVLIVNFSQPVVFAVEPIAMQAPDYVGAARRDPDGRSIRLALARKVTVNSIGA